MQAGPAPKPDAVHPGAPGLYFPVSLTSVPKDTSRSHQQGKADRGPLQPGPHTHGRWAHRSATAPSHPGLGIILIDSFYTSWCTQTNLASLPPGEEGIMF